MSLFTFNIYDSKCNNKELKNIFDLLTTYNLKLNTIMASISELEVAVDALQATLDAEQEQIAAAIAALNQAVSDLKALVVDGGTPEQRQALLDKIAAISADLSATIPDAPVA